MRVTLADALAGNVPDGVHRWSGETFTPVEIATACADAGWAVVHLGSPPGNRTDVLDAFADGFALPGWTGRNWDALEEALGDLGPGRYLVVWDDPQVRQDGAGQVLQEVLAAVTQDSASRGGRFVVLLRDPPGPDLAPTC